MRWSTQFVALVLFGARETVRQPVFLLLFLISLLVTGLTPLLQMFHFGEDGRLARDAGLAVHFVFGLLLACYAAGSALSRELSSGTAPSVLAKAVSRDLFFLAKYVGVCLPVLAFSLCSIAATLLAERTAEKWVDAGESSGYVVDWRTGLSLVLIPFLACGLAGVLNYRTRRPFAALAFWLTLLFVALHFVSTGLFDRSGRWAPYDLQVDWRLLQPGVLVAVALACLSAGAITLSVWLKTAPAMAAGAALFVLGLLSNHCFGGSGAGLWARLLYRIVPNWQHFWVSDGLAGEGMVPWRYVWVVAVYAALCGAGLLGLGMGLFRRKEIG